MGRATTPVVMEIIIRVVGERGVCWPGPYLLPQGPDKMLAPLCISLRPLVTPEVLFITLCHQHPFAKVCIWPQSILKSPLVLAHFQHLLFFRFSSGSKKSIKFKTRVLILHDLTTYLHSILAIYHEYSISDTYTLLAVMLEP